MNYKLLLHDLKAGLCKYKILLAPVFFLIPCSICSTNAIGLQIEGTWLDFVLSCFAGALPIEKNNLTRSFMGLPYDWLITISGCLLLNIDYILEDLATEGHQLLIRSTRRESWYISKVVWNFASTIEYMGFLSLTTLLFALSTNSRITLSEISDLTSFSYRGAIDTTNYNIKELILFGVVSPFLTLSAINMLQMTLCLYMRAAFSLLVSMSILIAGIFWNTPFSIANGAMGIRVIGFANTQEYVWLSFLLPILIFVLCFLFGCRKFKNFDVLEQELY